MDPRKKPIIREQLLKSALESGDTVGLQKLLNREPQLKRTTSKMLWYAVLNDRPKIAKMLLEAGADPNASKDNPLVVKYQSTILHELVKKKYDQLALLAMERGANVHALDEDFLTAFDQAVVKKSSLGIIRELMKRGSHKVSGWYGCLVVGAGNHPNSAELVDLLVSEFDDTNMEQEVSGALSSCLLDAFHESQVLPVVKTLLDVKQRIGQMEGDWSMVLQAMHARKVVLAQLLLDHEFHMDGLINGWPKPVIDLTKPLETTDQVVIKYLTLVIFKGKPINDRDLEIILSNPGTHAYHTQCLDELAKMKAKRVANNVSFFSVLVNTREMPFFTRNPNVVESYEAVQRKDEFPIYWKEMDLALRTATMLKRSLSEKEKAIFESLENILPCIPLEKIIYYYYLNEIK